MSYQSVMERAMRYRDAVKEQLRIRSRGMRGKRGQQGGVLNVIVGIIIGFFVVFLLYFAVIYAIAQLNAPSYFATSSIAANNTNNFQNNVTQVGSIIGNGIIPVFSIVVVVLLLAILGFLIFIVLRFRNAAGSGGGGLGI